MQPPDEVPFAARQAVLILHHHTCFPVPCSLLLLLLLLQMVPWHGPMTCCTASSDGTAKLLDLELGTSTELVDLNASGLRQVRVQGVKGCGQADRKGS